MLRIYGKVQTGNYVVNVYMNTEKRNKNEIVIHNNNMGTTVYTNEDVWDSDVFKIIRKLSEYEYVRISFEDLVKELNKTCRHLKIVI